MAAVAPFGSLSGPIPSKRSKLLPTAPMHFPERREQRERGRLVAQDAHGCTEYVAAPPRNLLRATHQR